jgi:cysteinylglycine-S-conjugate dipeptidase
MSEIRCVPRQRGKETEECSVSNPKNAAAKAHFETNFERTLAQLSSLVEIPSVSFAGFPEKEVRRSAEAVAALLKEAGLEKVEILELPGTHPYVYGEWIKNPDAPTALLYAHHDVQPAGRLELWQTAPFQATLKEGPGGMRLYGRGTADDKAGILVHLAAIEAFLKTDGKLPLNVKVVIEGEEEIGSTHLGAFLKTYREKLDADVLCLTDTTNFDCGIPALTIALRGMAAFQIEVRALTKSIHSGMWGGPVPDPAMALSKMLATLIDENGHIALKEITDQVPPLTEKEVKEAARLPYDERTFREQCGMVPTAHLHREGPNPLLQLWRFPSLTVNAIQASSRQSAGNIINDVAWAKVTVRLVQGMDPKAVTEAMKAHLKKVTPWGLELSIQTEGDGTPGWATEPSGEAFEAAKEAMLEGYGVDPLFIGCGGTIPFVKPFAEALGGAPALLIGVEDPYTNAHGENESLLVSDFKKACLSQIALFSKLGERLKKRKMKS